LETFWKVIFIAGFCLSTISILYLIVTGIIRIAKKQATKSFIVHRIGLIIVSSIFFCVFGGILVLDDYFTNFFPTEKEEVTAENGEKFTLTRKISSFDGAFVDSEIYDKDNNLIVSGSYDFPGEQQEKIRNAIISHWKEIDYIDNDENIECYKTVWCIIYRDKDGTLKGVTCENYDKECKTNELFAKVYAIAGDKE